ncbi:MAG TPA: TonB-dependent receptor [Nitrospira sp.]|nr:TonB-dependent receptor [Nitrospira sp.]
MTELAKLGHPMLAALLTVGLSAPVQAETAPPEGKEPKQEVSLTEELELINEEDTVSIASRYEQAISQTPSNVYIITDEDIRQSGAPDLPTVLRRIPGMEVMQTTGADFDVSVRGDNQLVANKLLVLVDGRSIYVDAQAIVYWKMIPVTLPEIKRIEVLKGPAAAIYGFNAFDGVVNIITKSPQEMRGTTLQFGGGAYGTISSSAIQAGTIGKLGYRLSLGHDQNQQWRNGDSLAFRANKFNVQTEYHLPAESKVLLSGGLVDSNHFDGPLQNVTLNTSTPALGYAHAVYERRNFFVRAFWNSWNDTSLSQTNPLLGNLVTVTDPNFGRTWGFRSNTYNVEAQHTVNLAAVNKLIYGINYRLNTLSGSIINGRNDENRLGFYLQDEWKIAERFTLVAGARYDLDTFIHNTISPRVALLFKPVEEHTFRFGVSVGYRPPTLLETYYNALIFTPGGALVTQGSKNLDPEQITSYELGYQGWYFKHRLNVRASLFYNHLADLIVPTTPQPIQGGNADIYGGEAGVDFLATHWLSGFANFSYQQIHQTFTGDAQRGGPRFKWNLGLRGEWENGLNGEIAYHYYGAATYPVSPTFALAPLNGFAVPDPRVGSYNLLNLRGGYKFWKQKASAGYLREAEVAVSAFNALNDKHKEHPLGDTIGSRVMGWLTVRF